MLSCLEHFWSCGELILWTPSRLILIPLIVLCAAPHHAPLFPGEWLPISFTAILGLTNGLFGNLPIILAPANVRDTSNLMTFSYCCGLTLGSLMSYGLDGMLGSLALPCFPAFVGQSLYIHRSSSISLILTFNDSSGSVFLLAGQPT